MVTPKAQKRSTLPTKRAAEPTTLHVPPLVKHPRDEAVEMDVQSMTVAGVTTTGIEDDRL